MRLPRTLQEATRGLSESKLAREILGEQFVEKSRTAPGHARNENRPPNPLLCRAKFFAPFFVQSQSSFQYRLEMNAHQETAERMKIGFPFQAVGENA